ncbi:beta 1-4 rhamnosyltransferase Cps2T [Enterocloster citroniae]|uniref:beta 1-4 rhamnosyltransferase Cps2T n=1 Tax=Enterocloster citroniae TaxID=358743 RepID=UPI0018971958|nr:DUF1972 domain-containing protein [Enterocloster citroniae]
MEQKDKQHVFIVGAKGVSQYGGYETFVDKLTEYHQNNKQIQYHIACKANGDGCMDENKLSGIKQISNTEFIYHNARCFKIKIPNIGVVQAIFYDVKALYECCEYIKRHRIKHPIIYILACRIGPFAAHYYRRIHRLGGKLYINPDGHEWMRAKWNKLIQKYWKVSERMMVKYCDLVICDSMSIEKYIHIQYDGKGINRVNPKTTFIAYGAENRKSKITDDNPKLLEWYENEGLCRKSYYLVVGRFVKENNYETMIREFIESHSEKDFVIITNVNNKFLDELETQLHFSKDKRIKFVGTVYDQELLMKIRENAYGYFHGHEVGGTNPSLLEALGSTELNLLLDVGFNREVAGDAAVYWNKENGSLASLIDQADGYSVEVRTQYGLKAKERIKNAYSWQFICNKYAERFLR